MNRIRIKTHLPVRFYTCFHIFWKSLLLCFSGRIAVSMVRVFDVDPIHPSLLPAIVGEFLQHRTADTVNAKFARLIQVYFAKAANKSRVIVISVARDF